MIEIKDVYKTYSNGVSALNGISISIYPGNLFML